MSQAKIDHAFAFAEAAHRGQLRKGTSVPYISHLLAVAAIALEYGANADQAAAALLHDVIEDCGATAEELATRFGQKVARIVSDCSDWTGPKGVPKGPWRERKQAYLEKLRHTDCLESLLVAAADKLHNARSRAHDLRHGDAANVWARFSASPEDTIWYYESALAVFHERAREAVGDGFAALIEELAAAIAAVAEFL